jgi:hypothetical protein
MEHVIVAPLNFVDFLDAIILAGDAAARAIAPA